MIQKKRVVPPAFAPANDQICSPAGIPVMVAVDHVTPELVETKTQSFVPI